MAGVEEVEVVVAHNERATLRVGDVFLKIDADQRRTDVEVEAMALAPVPTPEVLWHEPPPLCLAPRWGGRRSPPPRSRRPPPPPHGPPPAPPSGSCTTRRCRPGPENASTSSRP